MQGFLFSSLPFPFIPSINVRYPKRWVKCGGIRTEPTRLDKACDFDFLT